MSASLGVVMLMRKFYPLTGGYQNQALRLARAITARGVRVHVVTQRFDGLRPDEVHEGVPIHRVATLGRGHAAAATYLAGAFGWMARHRDRFDVIHANRSSSGLVAGLVGAALAKPVIYKLTRGDEIAVKRLGTTLAGRVKMWCLRRTVHRFVAITPEIAADLRALAVPEARIARVDNGIELADRVAAFDRDAERARLGWDARTPVATFVGRLVAAKGVDRLLDAWAALVRRDPDARLLVVGDGEERAALEAQVAALGLGEAVRFTGRQPDVYRYLALTDVFVLSSLREGMSNALLEAMSQGLPVVVADDELGGNRSVVTDGEDGLVLPPGDTARWAAVLGDLLRDPSARRRLGANAWATMAARCAIDTIADAYCAIYEDLARGTGAKDDLDFSALSRHLLG